MLSAVPKTGDRAFISKLCKNLARISVLVPPIAPPFSLTELLGARCGRRVLSMCPVIVDLEELSVIPGFLRVLRLGGWVPVYLTRWAGSRFGEAMWRDEAVDVVLEVKWLVKSFGWGWWW